MMRNWNKLLEIENLSVSYECTYQIGAKNFSQAWTVLSVTQRLDTLLNFRKMETVFGTFLNLKTAILLVAERFTENQRYEVASWNLRSRKPCQETKMPESWWAVFAALQTFGIYQEFNEVSNITFCKKQKSIEEPKSLKR